MSKRFHAFAFTAGLLVLGWVAAGFVGTSWLALAVTALIAAVYLLGAFELRQFRAATFALDAALRELAQPPAALADWLERVPATLRNAVRLRVEGERVALPAPALTPYLVGLLVMLGMLGTFLGMVVTFRGAVFALEGSTELTAIRAALAAPLKGLGLSFGTSVAGVAASAMLGLMATIARRERLEVARLLDTRVATVLLPFSLAHQRQETFRSLQAQAQVLPRVVDGLEALMQRIEQRSDALDRQLLERQAQFQREVTQAYGGLAERVGSSLQESMVGSARAAGETIQPLIETAMARIAEEARRMQQHASEQTLQAVERVVEQGDRLARERADSEARWTAQQADRMEQLTSTWRSELALLREQEEQRGAAAVQRLGELEAAAVQRLGELEAAAVQHLGGLEAAVTQHLGTLGAALEAPITRLLQTSSEVPQAAAGVIAQLREQMQRMGERDNLALQERTVLLEQFTTLLQTLQVQASQAGDMTAHVTASAVELASVAEAFGASVQQFQAGNEKLTASLQSLEGSLARSTARSDEQLAYYVAQAREVIDLSIASQQDLVENLRQLQARSSRDIAVVDEDSA